MNKIFNYVSEPHNLLHRNFGGMICGCMILILHFVSVSIFKETQGELGENREKWEDF
jgi:hypothetical protein